MTPLAIGAISFLVVIVLIAVRVPIAVALGGTAIVGMAIVRSVDVALGLAKDTPFNFAAHWDLTAIPMFLLMGSIAHHAGLSGALFRAARLWFGALPGGLAVAANLACAGFAAASGSSIATAAAMGRIAIPEMLRLGYDKSLATGVVASAGTLGALIPPSILFVIYGIFAEVSIVKLLIAGLLPGLLTAAVYTLMIIIRCRINPALAPGIDAAEFAASRRERWSALMPIWPLLVLILGIIGGLYAGFFTATEAGAAGALLAFVLAFIQGRLGWAGLKGSLEEAVSGSARIFFIAVGAVMYSKFLAFSGLPAYMGETIAALGVNKIVVVIGFSLAYLFLGMFLDPLGVLLLTLPILLPMFEALDLDLIWIGVLVVKYLEIGMLTPPVGFNVYIIKSVVGDEIPLETIFKGVSWFLACEVLIMGLLIAFPEISLVLPNNM
ncbi:MAG: TRAP transporter large permease [Hyphomicrobiaceae bacterium]